MKKIDNKNVEGLTSEKKKILKDVMGSVKIPESDIKTYSAEKNIKKCVLMAADGTFYKSESTRLGVDLDDCHIFQTLKQAKSTKERLEYCYGSETTYTIFPIKIVI